MKMTRKHAYLIVFLVIGVGIGGLFFVTRNRYESSSMSVRWEEGVGAGRPLVVEGLVVKDGQPVPGQQITIGTGSGDHHVTTDGDGSFSVNVGELEIVLLEVVGVDRIEWGLIFCPSARKGVRFLVELK